MGAESIYLPNFLPRTLLDVLEGVRDAQEGLGEGLGSISPAQGPHNPYQNVDFDLAVEAHGEGDGIGIVKAQFAEIPRESRSGVSRIQLTVPVRLPTR